MKLRFLAGMFAVVFSNQTMALDNVTDEAIKHCSDLHTMAISMYQLALKKDGSALNVFVMAENDPELQSLSMAAMRLVDIAERFGGIEKARSVFTADMLKVCLSNFHDKESISGAITEHAMLSYPKDENDPKYLRLKKAYDERKEEK